jgi:hypothetical protein
MSKHYAAVNKNANENQVPEKKEEVMEIKETIGSKIGKGIDKFNGKCKSAATSNPAKVLGGIALGIGAALIGVAIVNHKNEEDTIDLSEDEYSEVPTIDNSELDTSNLGDSAEATE